MKILVIVSQTQDTEAKIQVSASGDSIETGDMKWIMNPYDEFAVEEAIQTKEKHGGEVVIVSIGPARVVDTIRQALAMGADSAVHINGDSFADTDPFATGAIIASEIKKLGDFDVIFTGMKIIDEESGQVGVQVAEELGIPHVSLVSNVVEINAIEVRKAVPLLAVGQNIFEHTKFKRVIMISQHNGFHLFKYLERDSDFPIHQDVLDLAVGKHAARLFSH